MDLTDSLREYAKTLELDVIGFCSARRLDDAPEDRNPQVFLRDAKSIISIGYKLNYSPIQNLPESRTAYMLEHDYANRHLSMAAQKITRFLEKQSLDAVGFDAGAGFYREAGKTPKRLAGDFSHKHAAVASGLGKFGLNNLVLSVKWGPRFRLSTIITNAKLEYDPPHGYQPVPYGGM
jgi:epoxyqueuosine reductase QueG